MARPCRDLDEAQRLQLTAHRALVQGDPELVPEPLYEILQAPAHHAVDSRDRPALDDLAKRPTLSLRQLRARTWGLAVDQTIGPLGVETQNPVANDLKPNPAERRRIAATAPFVDYCQRQKAPGLIGIPRASRKTSKLGTVVVFTQTNRM